MLRYLARRTLWLLVTLVLIVGLTFTIFFVLPTVDPARLYAGKTPSPETMAEVRRQLGLDKPVLTQFGVFLRNLVLGDEYGWPGLGFSYSSRSPLRPIILERLGVTMQLALGAAVMWLALGVPIGVMSALRRRSVFDRLSMAFALVGVSAPVFFVGPLFLYVFWFKLRILPGSGYYPIGQHGVVEWLLHFIMPWTVLALAFAAVYARMSRANMIETMAEDFIRTARAKGLTRRAVTVRHGFRASLTPLVTLLGLDLGGLLGGAVITETVFNIPGLGQYAVASVSSGNLSAILAVTIVAAIFITTANLLVDILYAFVDPRVRYS